VRSLCLGLAVLLCLPAAAAAAEASKAKALGDLKLPELPRMDEGPKAAGEVKEGEAKAAPADKPQRTLDVAGMLFDQESIRQVVAFHMPEIQECYEQVLSDTGKKLEGKVVVHFVINTEGRVSQAKPVPKKSTLKDERLVSCVLALRGWAFPKPSDNRDHPVEYPFVLSVKK
jgi:hypothetical protein